MISSVQRPLVVASRSTRRLPRRTGAGSIMTRHRQPREVFSGGTHRLWGGRDVARGGLRPRHAGGDERPGPCRGRRADEGQRCGVRTNPVFVSRAQLHSAARQSPGSGAPRSFAGIGRVSLLPAGTSIICHASPAAAEKVGPIEAQGNHRSCRRPATPRSVTRNYTLRRCAADSLGAAHRHIPACNAHAS